MSGEQLRAFRKSRGWTQQQLADFIGDSLERSYSHSAVGDWEREKSKTPEAVSAFLTAVSLDETLGAPDEHDAPHEPADGAADTIPTGTANGDTRPTPALGTAGVYSRVCTELWEMVATGVGMVGAVVGNERLVRDGAIIDADKAALGHAYGKLAETNETFRKMLGSMVESGAWLEVGLVTAGTAGKLWRNHAVIPLGPASVNGDAAYVEQPAPATS